MWEIKSIAYFFVSLLLQNLIGDGLHVFAAETVEAKRIRTGIVVQRLFVDADGKYACIFGQAPQSKRRSYSIKTPPQELVVVDLERGEEVVRCRSVGWVQSALIENNQIIWALQREKALHRLRFESSSQQDQLTLEYPVVQVFKSGSEEFGLVHLLDRGGAVVAIRDQKSLSENKERPLSQLRVHANQRIKPVFYLGDSLLSIGSRVIDQDTGMIRCYTLKGRKPSQLGKVRKEEYIPSFEYFGDAYWRRRLYNRRSLEQFGGTAKTSIQSEFSWLSRSRPLLVSLERTRGKDYGHVKFEVLFRDLVHGQILGNVELPDQVEIGGSQLTLHRAICMERKTLLVACWDELFIAELPEEYLRDSLLEPIRLVYPTLPIVDISQPLSFQLKALGGKPPYRYDAIVPEPGVSVFPDTGKVSVDFTVGWETLSDYVKKRSHPYNANNISSATIEDATDYERRSIGLAEGKAVVSLPVQFVVTDQGGQRDSIYLSLLANMTEEDFKKKLYEKAEKPSRIWNFFGK